MSKQAFNNTTVRIIGFVFLVALGVILWRGSSAPGDATFSPSIYSASELLLGETSFDFGEIVMGDGRVSRRVELTNNGGDQVTIEKVYTSCMCTTASIITASGERYGVFGMQGHGGTAKTKIEIGAGESVTLEVVFDPAAHGPSGVGSIQRSIYIETNSAKSPKLELPFQATVTR